MVNVINKLKINAIGNNNPQNWLAITWSTMGDIWDIMYNMVQDLWNFMGDIIVPQ
jgi:hypothetical protein